MLHKHPKRMNNISSHFLKFQHFTLHICCYCTTIFSSYVMKKSTNDENQNGSVNPVSQNTKEHYFNKDETR